LLTLLFLSSCVSLKKYNTLKQVVNNKDSTISKLQSDSAKIFNSLKKIDIENQKLNEQIFKLTNTVENMSNRNKILEAKDLIPMIPLPPPKPSDFLLLINKDILKLKKYSQVDSLISEAFKSANYQKNYLAVQNGGFAIATNFEEIGEKGNESSKKESVGESIVNFFNRHAGGLFFSKTGYYRSIIIVVSPNIEALGGTPFSYDQIQSWLDANAIKLPKETANQTVPKDLQIIALLYEFEQNENVDAKVQILTSSKIKTKLALHPLVQKLNNGN